MAQNNVIVATESNRLKPHSLTLDELIDGCNVKPPMFDTTSCAMQEPAYVLMVSFPYDR